MELYSSSGCPEHVRAEQGPAGAVPLSQKFSRELENLSSKKGSRKILNANKLPDKLPQGVDTLGMQNLKTSRRDPIGRFAPSRMTVFSFILTLSFWSEAIESRLNVI